MKNHLWLLLFSLFSIMLSAQTEPITLFEQFNGQLDFTGFGNTLNPQENNAGGTFDILNESSAELNLAPGQTLVAAYLYWAGSGSGDFFVDLNGTPVFATRTFSAQLNTTQFAFGAFADVTPIVQTSGNGTYTFSDFDINAEAANYGSLKFAGWSVVVVYEDLTLTQNQVSIFDGFDFVAADNPEINFTLDNLDIASPILSKVSFLAWEGDAVTAPVNETLSVNGTLLSNAQNPADNAFNGTNSYDGNNNQFNMDLDVYALDALVAPGDTSIDIQLTSGLDLVIVHNVVTNVNSEIPDATIVIDDIGVLCSNNNIDVDYTVFNIESTEELPAGMPIAFYADGVLVGQALTTGIIPIGGSESGTVTLNFPPGGATPVVFTLTAVVDDDGTGVGIVSENNEDNNTFDLLVDLSLQGLNIGPDLTPCLNDIVTIGQELGPTFTYQWFFNGAALPGGTGPFYNPTLSGTYTLNAFEGICFVSGDVEVTFQPLPVAVTPDDLRACDELPNDGFATFDLTVRDAQIANGQPGTVTYHISQAAALTGVFPFMDPTMYINTVASFQTVYARFEDANGCRAVVPLNLVVNDSPAITDPISDYFLCDLDGDGLE
ncbi:CARDB domain-containing protein, partial [Patiriisocius marinus]|uniref:CARDB domain-containing protein n=1 Tax=Patiriisocius marinus TaxID=1397112 RepID=UPI00232B07DE